MDDFLQIYITILIEQIVLNFVGKLSSYSSENCFSFYLNTVAYSKEKKKTKQNTVDCKFFIEKEVILKNTIYLYIYFYIHLFDVHHKIYNEKKIKSSLFH